MGTNLDGDRMKDVRRGDIWLVNLDPTIGHEIKKLRPAVIVQNDIGNRYSPITIIAPVTSQHLERVYPIEVLLTRDNSRLTKESKVLLGQIRAIDKQRLVKKVGKLDEETIGLVNEALKISLSLD